MQKSSQSVALGIRLKTLRISKGWRQAEAAKRLGISLSLYSKLEVGIQNLTRQVLQNICALFDVSADYILNGQPDPISRVVRETPSQYGKAIDEMGSESMLCGDVKSAVEQLAKATGMAKEEVLNAICDALKRKVLGNTKAG